MLMGLYNYWIVVVLMMVGFYIVIAHGNLIKKIVGLSISETPVLIYYICMTKVDAGQARILPEGLKQSWHVPALALIRTRIVVSIHTTAWGASAGGLT